MRKTCWNLFVTFLLLAVCAAGASAEQKEIRLLYINDFHGFAEPHKPLGSQEMLGGIAFLAAKADKLRTEKPSLLLAAGDMIQGNNWANLFQGRSVIEVMNAMKFDAMVVGNHEFDFGQEILKKRISEAGFAILGANVEGLTGLRPFIVKEVGEIRVGIIGVVTEDAPVSTHPRNVGGLIFHKPSDSIRKYMDELRKKSDIIVVLSHEGYVNDRDLAEQIHNIGVIVGGHSHTRLLNPVVVGNTIIVQAWEHAKALGVLDLTIEDGKIKDFKGHLEEIKPAPGGEDKAVSAISEKYRRDVDTVLNEAIGVTTVDLDGENVRTRETNLGDFIADIMKNTSGSDVALINGGTIRTSIRKGVIKVKDVYSVLPFDNYIVAIKLTGKQIYDALEHGVSAVEKGEGRFPQVSGLMFKYSLSSPRGKRITEVLINGKGLELQREYVVATNDFLAVGGDGYKAFGEAAESSRDFEVIGGMMKGENVVFSDAGRWLRDVVIADIKEKKEISPLPHERIIRVD
ncbi:MAG TPA: 5'-nucleotidase C-terminal domain-containing protein [Thermodesulfovibrionales bacterium]|nr:5'-nucleotidase C-terminal domain-containing protein [Thermodesulfovibrionales bacterium]